jgi:hypothetical protein
VGASKACQCAVDVEAGSVDAAKLHLGIAMRHAFLQALLAAAQALGTVHGDYCHEGVPPVIKWYIPAV